MERWLPLVGIATFLVFGMGTRSVLYRRRYGTSGLVLLRARDRGEVARRRLLVGIVVVLLAQSIVLAVRPHALDACRAFRSPVWIGAVVLAIGTALEMTAQAQMGASWRIGIDADAPSELVTRGLFRFSRNPIYSFVLLAVVGIALLAPTWISLAMLLAAFAGMRAQVAAEERHLRATHGAAYVRYAQRVGRFLPWIGRIR
ncbi:MAG TPA: isoprenylcysteine carboxylmethyltransferase family protein [Planctomycetota bacterium]|jgi:protein-S-isoprenylcysteine O-methyltransferase Ste14|nr:isoprenylcysteine carboxylmethyltransferase family protein [Planctomycetota bacterium]